MTKECRIYECIRLGISYKFHSLFFYFRAEDEAEFREFLETVAVVLCSDIEITPDTFHRAARGYGVSNEIKQVLLIITYVSIKKIRITLYVYSSIR